MRGGVEVTQRSIIGLYWVGKASGNRETTLEVIHWAYHYKEMDNFDALQLIWWLRLNKTHFETIVRKKCSELLIFTSWVNDNYARNLLYILQSRAKRTQYEDR